MWRVMIPLIIVPSLALAQVGSTTSPPSPSIGSSKQTLRREPIGAKPPQAPYYGRTPPPKAIPQVRNDTPVSPRRSIRKHTNYRNAITSGSEIGPAVNMYNFRESQVREQRAYCHSQATTQDTRAACETAYATRMSEISTQFRDELTGQEAAEEKESKTKTKSKTTVEAKPAPVPEEPPPAKSGKFKGGLGGESGPAPVSTF